MWGSHEKVFSYIEWKKSKFAEHVLWIFVKEINRLYMYISVPVTARKHLAKHTMIMVYVK